MVNERIEVLERQLTADQQTAIDTIEELNAELKREKIEHSVTMGVLDTARRQRGLRLINDVRDNKPHRRASRLAIFFVSSVGNAPAHS